ncbi:hypothetical protein CN639_27635 [Bacillus toyonensis]|uniref:Uncharacterized protein n=1 Tax=Bacillus toyonensis TaxID=155322 RepID=A0AB36SZX9_9BACI|nr:hypothetical protein CON55_00415 [Bacillus toyonensis]PED89132.1 hypothetical protein CON90_30680 [Bacillus toyonensis]PEL54332.1 hypothetical protein CN633_28310 [Bacillus toyonensis]PEM81212.1 hypothetical protein CN639_27635 [Bacillus toyonensis]PEN45947.1 hypothetical protein CN540_29375 [Bacillus toyonensis]
MEPLIDVILYFVFYFGALVLILGTALVLFIASALPVIRKKNLSFIMISLGLNYSPLNALTDCLKWEIPVNTNVSTGYLSRLCP